MHLTKIIVYPYLSKNINIMLIEKHMQHYFVFGVDEINCRQEISVDLQERVGENPTGQELTGCLTFSLPNAISLPDGDNFWLVLFPFFLYFYIVFLNVFRVTFVNYITRLTLSTPQHSGKWKLHACNDPFAVFSSSLSSALFFSLSGYPFSLFPHFHFYFLLLCWKLFVHVCNSFEIVLLGNSGRLVELPARICVPRKKDEAMSENPAAPAAFALSAL